MGSILETRREDSRSRLDALRAKLGDVDEICRESACVYVTGSFGRGEAHPYSDLDLFILGEDRGIDDEERRSLSKLDEICVKAKLIEAVENSGLPRFSGDGEYLTHYTDKQLIRYLGSSEDDWKNTFTARLLLLLESRLLIGDREVYKRSIDDVIGAYWKDFPNHSGEFVPAFLANDILRLWRTLCVNYEARTRSGSEYHKAKRKLKNYKVKHSRLLTCYSSIIYLLKVYDEFGTVDPESAQKMVEATPTQRLEWVRSNDSTLDPVIASIMGLYESFLELTNEEECELISKFKDREFADARFDEANKFGDKVAELLHRGSSGKGSRFRRMLVV